jgi:hypothetical protein
MIAGGVIAAVGPVGGHETMSSAASGQSASRGSATAVRLAVHDLRQPRHGHRPGSVTMTGG